MNRKSKTNVGFSSFIALIYVFIFAPIVIVVYMSFGKDKSNQFPLQEFSLDWYEKLFQNMSVWGSYRISLIIALTSTFIVLILATLAAYAIVRYRFKFKSVFISLMLAPMLIPAVITGISMLLYYNFLSVPSGMFTVVIGHVVLSLPYAAMIITARMQGFDVHQEEAARNLGASDLTTFRKILMPYLMPGLIGGGLFALTISLDEFALTFFLNSPSTQTLPIRIYSMLRFGITPELNALSTIILLVSIGIVTLGTLAQKKNIYKEEKI